MEAVRYRVQFPSPGAHLVAVRLEFVAAGPEEICRLRLPAWTPGSYLIREYARNIRTLTARVDGQDVKAEKLAKDRWEIPARAGQRILVDYTVYAHELSVRTAHHDATHAFLHPPQLFLTPEAAAGPFTIEVELPPGWSGISLAADPTAQERRSPGLFALEVPDLDSLHDTPIEVGELTIVDLPEPAQHVRVAVWGEPLPEFVLPRLARVVAQVERTWPARPFGAYTFLVHAVVGSRGGLEHLAGSVLGVDPESFGPAVRRLAAGAALDDEGDAGVVDFLELASHELFHAWNVKRLRPRALGPFDYGAENYTRELWIAEGFTSYYDGLCVLRSGEISVKAYLGRLAESIGRLADTPGRRVQSVAESSFDAWIKLYRPQDDAPNASVSYYLKGSLVALLLDLWLRERGATLDAVMTALWRRGPGDRDTRGPSTRALYAIPGFTREEFESILAEISGVTPLPDDLVGLWSRPDELDYSRLARLGLRLSEKPGAAGGIDLGATTQDRNGGVWIEHVRADSPAERAGLSPGDEVLAARAAAGAWRRLRPGRGSKVWDHLRPGEPATLLVSRRERLHELTVTFAAARGAPQLERIADADADAKARFEAWSGRGWSDA